MYSPGSLPVVVILSKYLIQKKDPAAKQDPFIFTVFSNS